VAFYSPHNPTAAGRRVAFYSPHKPTAAGRRVAFYSPHNPTAAGWPLEVQTVKMGKEKEKHITRVDWINYCNPPASSSQDGTKDTKPLHPNNEDKKKGRYPTKSNRSTDGDNTKKNTEEPYNTPAIGKEDKT
jgi:hypothetical protein